ncbi:MAG: urease accessory protein [Bacteroidota bacterium]
MAVSSLVTKQRSLGTAVKDGIYWGLGHSSTILLVGLVMIVGKATFLNSYFLYFEAIVGLMLILLGGYRLYQYFNTQKKVEHQHEHQHKLAYGVGLIHGLAGSGAMVLLVMTEVQNNWNSLLYLIIFGLGSALGMLVAAGIFSLPFSKKLVQKKGLQFTLILLSSLLCIGYGVYIMIENLS